MEKHKFRPECIWNIDETGCSTVQTPRRQLAKKGEKRVGSIVSHEKGSTITLCGAVNAIGNSIPPFLIFPRVNVQEHWTLAAPARTLCDTHPKASGWMTSENFMNFLKHFYEHTKPSKDRPVLMILDNHASHCSEGAIRFCRENYITLLSFPPHCSHEMQSLDKSVYGSFQLYYDHALEMWCKDPANAGKQMSIHSVPQMVSYAFSKAFTPANILPGFKSTGMHPMDRNIFPDHKFTPSYSTDRPAPIPNRDEPASDSDSELLQTATTSPAPSKSDTFTSPKEIRPFPKAPARTEDQKKIKAVIFAILTSTPEKLSSQTVTITAAGPSKPKKLHYDSDDDEEANNVLENILIEQMEKEEGEFLETIEHEIDHEMAALRSSLSDVELETLRVGDFIFFKCNGKKSTGIVKQLMDGEGDFEIEYLKRCEKVKNKFVIFKNDETWSLHKEDIISLLTKSENTTQGTRRTNSGHVFIEDIVKYAA
ncbi:hypothetical protein RRG08_041818 [Elysia crispata]|uniref:DDE-1 domain-containing protein n=1 Tax=Elysia crispata TaxID=231223 RepID=A0AAE0XYU8_9GAST|nr:hypothetical protein RRG08_041818 [Elysia crispata]